MFKMRKGLCGKNIQTGNKYQKDCDFNPVWDANLPAGERFTNAIRHGIAHAH